MNIVVSKVPKPFASIRLKSPELMQEIGDFIVNHIRTRTDQGRGVDGRFFPALSPGYAARKAKALGSTRADLSVSGDMLNALQATVMADGRVTVSVVGSGAGGSRRGTFIQRSRSVSPSKKAEFHQLTGAGKSHVVRKFIGISQEAKDTVTKFVSDHLGREVARRT